MPDGSARLRGRPIGAHAPTSGGLASGSLRYAAAVGAEAIQVFVANPRSWALTRRDAAQQAAQEEALREAAAEARMPVFVHAPYLVNVASPDPRLRALSARSIRHSLARGAAIGARGVVVHAGSATDGNRDGGLARALRLDAGPSRCHRPGPDRHGRVRQPAEPSGDRRGSLRGRDSWRWGRSGRRHRGPA